MQFRDRIKELRRVPAGELRANAKNWRRHPAEQRQALRGILREVGFAAAVIARELADGSLEVIDGHLRARTAADALVPVLVLDVNEQEANKLLATFDVIGQQAVPDLRSLDALVVDLDIDSDPLKQALERVLGPFDCEEAKQPPSNGNQHVEIFQIVIDCADEAEQREVYERLTAEGYTCALRTM